MENTECLALNNTPSLLTVWFHRGGTRFLLTPYGGGGHLRGDPTGTAEHTTSPDV